MGGEWPKSAAGLSINELELFVIAIAAKKWGPKWARKKVIATCDNMASVWTINTGSARNPAMMVAMRELFLAAARNSFEMKSKYINTKLNVMADAISRGDLERFFKHAREVCGLNKLTRVEPNTDVAAVVSRMQKARRGGERREALRRKEK